jgi:heme oxygenase
MILERLREETQINHNKLEGSPLLTYLTSKEITIPVYTTILNKFYGFFNPLEQLLNNLNGFPDLFSDYNERRKSEMLLEDLKKINSNIQITTLSVELPVVINHAQALGAMYVMEGSTLGGRVISKMLKENLGLEMASGAGFFNGYGSQTMMRWNSFKEVLLNHCSIHGCDDEVITSANDTFLKFYSWMNK